MVDRYICHICHRITRSELPTVCLKCGSNRTEKVFDIHPTRKCLCGCGYRVLWNKHKNWYNDYMSGHNQSRWKY